MTGLEPSLQNGPPRARRAFLARHLKPPFAESCPPPARPTALAALRQATRERHERIDALMDLRRLGQRDHYARVLQLFDAFLAPWEAAVAAALPAAAGPWLRQRSRRPFLRQDLRALSVAALPWTAPGLAFANPAAAWGSLYVIEGSALGGQVITRALAEAGVHPGHGGAYFHGWGAATGTMWAEFRARLETELPDPARVAAACGAACLTFDALSALLETLPHERIALA